MSEANARAFTPDTSILWIPEAALKTQLFELECPEAQGLASKAAAVRMAERSDACTKAYFRTFKAQAKQQSNHKWMYAFQFAKWDSQFADGCGSQTV